MADEQYNPQSATEDTSWHKSVIEKLATASLNEQKSARRWSSFLKF